MSSFEFIVTPDLCDQVPNGWLVELYDVQQPLPIVSAVELQACSVTWRGTEDSGPIVGAEFSAQLYFPDRTDPYFTTLYQGLESEQERRIIVRIRRNIPGAPTPYWYGVIVNDLTTYSWGDCDVTVNLTGGESWESLKNDFTTPPLLSGQEETGYLRALAYILNRSLVGTWLPPFYPEPYVISHHAFTSEATGFSLQYSLWHQFVGLFYDVAADDTTRVPVSLYDALVRLLTWGNLRLYQFGGRIFMVNEASNSTSNNCLAFSKTVQEAKGSNTPTAGSIIGYKYPPVDTPTLNDTFYGLEGFVAPLAQVNTGLDSVRNLPRIAQSIPPGVQKNTNGPHTQVLGAAAGVTGLFYNFFLTLDHRCSFSNSTTVKTLRVTAQIRLNTGTDFWYWTETGWSQSLTNIVREELILPTPGDPWIETTHVFAFPAMPAAPVNGTLEFVYTTSQLGGGVGLIFSLLNYAISYEVAPASSFNGILYRVQNEGTNKASSQIADFQNWLWAYSDFEPISFPLGWYFYQGGTNQLKRVAGWYFPPFNSEPGPYWQYILDLRMYRRFLQSRYLDADFVYNLGSTPIVNAQLGGAGASGYPLEWRVDMITGRVAGRWWTYKPPGTAGYLVSYLQELK